MLLAMKKRGKQVIATIDDPDVQAQVLKNRERRFESAPSEANLPELGDLFVFQNKGVKY